MMWLWWLACAGPLGDTAAAPIALDGATVVVGGTLVPEGQRADVLVTDGEIRALLAPDGTYVDGAIIDASGLYVVPGLTDLHVHQYYTGDYWLYLAAGVTTVRNLFGSEDHLQWRTELASGELDGPTLITSGPIIDGTSPTWQGSARVADAEDAQRVAEEQISLGYDVLKVYDGVPADAWEALVAAGEAAGVPVVGHVPDAVGYDAAANGGQQTIEHLDDWAAAAAGAEPFSGFDIDEGEAALAALTDEAALTMASDTAAAGVFNVPTLTVWHQLARADDWDFEDPRLDTLHRSIQRSWQGTADSLTGEDIAWFGRYSDALCGFIGSLHDAGAPLALGTDVINPFVFPGASVHEELELLVSCGLTPTEALATATTGAAAVQRQVGEFGVIMEGARADLLLVADDPTADLTALREPVGVMARGRYYTAEALEKALEEVAESYR